jgi:uncharacterized protein (DUF488 family)
MSDKLPTLWTIGHSTRTTDEFVQLLKAHGIFALADVRQFPGSRRLPHFNQEPLASALDDVGIEYVHFPGLGGRRRARPGSPNTGWRNESFRGYADHINTEEFRTGIERLLKLARRKPTAMMCAEALWWQCHRRIIADYLKAHGHQVSHILAANKTEPHPFTSPARIVNGTLSYAADEPAELFPS